MPVCKHCGVRISKFDTDRCPICGELHPLKDVRSDTIELTGEIKVGDQTFTDFHPVKKMVFLLLSCLIGWTGASWFYARYKKQGLFWLLINVALIGGLFGLLFIFTKTLWLSILIPVVFAYLVNVVMGVYIFKNPTFKDGNGNLLR